LKPGNQNYLSWRLDREEGFRRQGLSEQFCQELEETFTNAIFLPDSRVERKL